MQWGKRDKQPSSIHCKVNSELWSLFIALTETSWLMPEHTADQLSRWILYLVDNLERKELGCFEDRANTTQKIKWNCIATFCLGVENILLNRRSWTASIFFRLIVISYFLHNIFLEVYSIKTCWGMQITTSFKKMKLPEIPTGKQIHPDVNLPKIKTLKF